MESNLELYNAVKKVQSDFNVSAREIEEMLMKMRKKEDMLMLRNRVQSNVKYVGLCYRRTVAPHDGLFPEISRYYKVISERSSNEYRVECLIFDEFPCYWFDYQSSMTFQAGNYYEGHFDFDSFWTDSVMVSSLEKMELVPSEEFDRKAKEYTAALLEMKWTPDHYRAGGKFPGDKGWEEKRRF